MTSTTAPERIAVDRETAAKKPRKKREPVVLTFPPILLRAPLAAAACGQICLATFYERVADGTLPPGRMMKGVSVWLYSELVAAGPPLPVSNIPPPSRGGGRDGE